MSTLTPDLNGAKYISGSVVDYFIWAPQAASLDDLGTKYWFGFP